MDSQTPHSYIALEPFGEHQVAHQDGVGSHTSPGNNRSSSKLSLDGVTISPGHNGQLPTNKRLRRRPTVVYLVAFYVVVSVYSWVVISMLSSQQVNRKLGTTGTRLYKAAKFFNGAVGILAFPVATAVCARAVVPYVQTKRNGLTLRQTLLLADRSWTSPQTWAGQSLPKKQNLFLWLAFWIHLIGFAVFSLQQALIGEVTVKHHGNVERRRGVHASKPNQFRTPQTISEALYLKIFVSGDFDPQFPGFSGGPSVFKVEAESTSGYFELPNYFNNNTAGDLLPRDPDEFCDEHCPDQGDMPVIITNNRDMRSASLKSKRWSANFTSTPDPDSREVAFQVDMEYENSEDLDNKVNLGPLYTVAEALFGNSSFIAARSHSPLAYTGTGRDGPCRDLAPLVSLMTERRGSNHPDIREARLDCLRRPDGAQVTWQIANWLGLFWANDSGLDRIGYDDPETFQMRRTLTAAVYLAHKGWLLSGNSFDRNFEVRFDVGNDAPMPMISSAGVIAISVLLGTFLLSLIAMAAYTYSVPTFTSTLDAFVMLRSGAQWTTDDSTGPLPALLAHPLGATALDRNHGWFGDGNPNEDVGRVELGAYARLRNGREYLAS